MALGWEFILANSKTMEDIGKLRNAHDRTISVDLNKSGQASAWNPTNDPYSGEIAPWSTCLVVQYTQDLPGQIGSPSEEDPIDHVPFIFWSGPITSRVTDLEAGRCTFSAQGWFERLMHLNLQVPLQFTDKDAGEIASDLLAQARLLDPALPITMGSVETTQKRTISYQIDQNIGQAIQDLVALESGFDWIVHPSTREFMIYRRRGVDRPDCQWKYIDGSKSMESNLSNVVENVDGSVLVNDYRARGQYGTGLATDIVSQDQYGVFMESQTLSDVTNTNILLALANAEIVYRSQPRVTYTISPKPSTKSTVPRLFRDFDIGDVSRLTARKDFVEVLDQPIRIFGTTLAISDSGVESLTNLQVTAG